MSKKIGMSVTSNKTREVKSEILIIGSEAAGAKAAIEAEENGADVLVVTKGLVGKSGNTVMAGWGIQARTFSQQGIKI